MKIFLPILGYVFCVLVMFLFIYHRKALIAFFISSKQEIKRVSWPTPEKVFSQMKVVLVSLFVFSIFFGLMDYLLYRLVNLIFWVL